MQYSLIKIILSFGIVHTRYDLETKLIFLLKNNNYRNMHLLSTKEIKRMFNNIILGGQTDNVKPKMLHLTVILMAVIIY